MRKMAKRIIGGAAALATVPALAFVAIQPTQATQTTEASQASKESRESKASLRRGASAETSAQCLEIEHGSYGWGCFQPYGDKLEVNDTLWDGWGVVVHWKTSYGREGTCAADGADYGTKTCNYNMREGEKLNFRVELWDDGRADGWTAWKTVTI